MEKIITNVNLLYGEELDERVKASVWIKDGIIQEVSDNLKALPTNVEVTNAHDSYMIPGLIDLHVHLMWSGSSDPVETQVNDGFEQMLIRAVSNSYKYLSAGITTVRDVGSVDDIALHVARSVKMGIVEGPNIIASGKTLTMTGGHDPFWARFLDGTDEALKATREQIFKGAQVIKVSATGGVYGRSEGESALNSELSYEELKTICNIAHQFGLKVASHAIGREGILNSINAGVDTIEHGHFLDEELIQMMIEKNIAWIPTLYTYQQNAYTPGVPEYAQKKAKEIVGVHREAFSKYFNRDILIGCGTDAGAPNIEHPSILKELLTMDKIISNPKEILKTATSNAGKILGKNIGVIKEGYSADFILLEKNPLNDLNNLEKPEKVYKNGILIHTSFNNS